MLYSLEERSKKLNLENVSESQSPAKSWREFFGNPNPQNLKDKINDYLIPDKKDELVAFAALESELTAIAEDPFGYLSPHLRRPAAAGLNLDESQQAAADFLNTTLEHVYEGESRDKFVMTVSELRVVALSCLFAPDLLNNSNEQAHTWGWQMKEGITDEQRREAVQRFIDQRTPVIAEREIQTITVAELKNELLNADSAIVTNYRNMGLIDFLEWAEEKFGNVPSEDVLKVLNHIKDPSKHPLEENSFPTLIKDSLTPVSKPVGTKQEIKVVAVEYSDAQNTIHELDINKALGILGGQNNKIKSVRSAEKVDDVMLRLKTVLLGSSVLSTKEVSQQLPMLNDSDLEIYNTLVPSLRAVTKGQRSVMRLLETSTLIEKIVSAIEREDEPYKVPINQDLMTKLANSTYQRIIPVGGAPIPVEITEEEFNSLSDDDRSKYRLITTTREFYYVSERHALEINRAMKEAAENGEPFVIFYPTCPCQPYKYDESKGMIEFIPGPLYPDGMNHTGSTAVNGTAPLMNYLLENIEGLKLELMFGTGAEEWEQGRTHGMDRDDYRRTLSRNHPVTVKKMARLMGALVDDEDLEFSEEQDHMRRAAIQGLENGRLTIVADSLTGLAGGPEVWAETECAARKLIDKYFRDENNEEFISQVLNFRTKFYSFVLADRYGIMDNWDMNNDQPSAEDYEEFMLSRIAETGSNNPREELHALLMEELKSDALYYATFHLMAKRKWGDSMAIVAADSRALQLMASKIVGTENRLFMLYGNYEGSNFEVPSSPSLTNTSTLPVP
ncbi:MAG TPA: hypothetical protein VK338_03625 [Candidatus Nitrosocosmicus sp.]|nr:hypothetical protein [Candidatus Nitrosocosmicus sp.]